MGERSRERRARRAWLVPPLLAVVRPICERIARMPMREAYRLSTRLALLLRFVFWVLGDPTERNLELACGALPPKAELKAFKRRYYRHLALLLVEFLRLPAVTRENLAHHTEAEDLAKLRAIYERGQGMICVAGHAGVWELAGHMAGLIDFKILSVAKFSGQPELDEWVLSRRQAGGQQVRDVRGSIWSMKKALGRGEAVGINVDQEARQNRVFAPFFGIPAATSTAPASLHLRTKAPIVVVTAHRVAPFRYRLRIYEEINHPKTDDKEADLLAITTRINAAMEASIRDYPEQWLWSHRRWRRRPEGEDPPFGKVVETPPLRLTRLQSPPQRPPRLGVGS